MEGSKQILLLLLSCLISLELVQCKRIKDGIYTDLKPKAFCFRRTNGTHQMGCSSDPNGNVGVVHLISNNADRDWLLEKGTHDPYIALLTPKMFTKDSLVSLKKSGKISGIILLGVNKSMEILAAPNGYSDDAACPNQMSSMYANDTELACKANVKPWNPYGSDILLEDWSFPIFLVDEPDIVDALLHRCYDRFNKPTENGEPREWPLCAAELVSHMFGAVDTTTCQRRNSLINPFSPTLVCDPMGDKNVFHLSGKNDQDFSKEKYEDKSILLVSARLDAANIFDKAEIGLDSPTSGIVALLAIANMLYKDESFIPKEGKNVLFAFFNGESFDYVGSSRMVYDMEQSKFPREESSELLSWPKINLKSILAHIELGQLLDKNEQLFAHVDSAFNDEDLLKNLKNEAATAGLTVSSSSTDALPPSSAQSLLKQDRSIPAILLNNFDQTYSNSYYHSLYDNATLFGYNFEDGESSPVVQNLAKVTEAVGKFIQSKMGRTSTNLKANKTLINDLLNCFAVTAKCSSFLAVTSPSVGMESLPSYPFQQYVGVERGKNLHRSFTHRLLAYYTSKPLVGPFTSENCTAPDNQNVYSYVFIKGEGPPSWWTGTTDECDNSIDCGHCLNTTAWMSDAISPAFVIDGYDFSDPTYGAWSESLWELTSSRMFLKAAPSRERGYFALGIIVLILSFTTVIWTDKYAAKIFVDSSDEPLLEENPQISAPTAL